MMRLCFIALLCASVGLLLSELGFRGKKVFSSVGVIALLALASEGLSSLLYSVLSFSEAAGISEAARCGVKVLGCGYIFGMTADLCSELGEGGVASALTVAGRIEIILLVLPFFEKVLALGAELIK